jgi:hypothetical protein
VLVWLRLILVLLAASSAAALPSFEIGEPAHAPTQARFVIGSDEGFFALSRGFMTRVTRDGAIVDPAGRHLFSSVSPPVDFSDLMVSATSAAGLVVASCKSGFGAGQECERTAAVTADGRPAWTVEGVGGRVLFDGTNFVVIESRTETFRATVIDRAGAVLRSFDILLPQDKDPSVTSCCVFSFAVAQVGDDLIISWIGRRETSPYTGSYVLTAMRVSLTGRAGPPIVLDGAVDGFELAMVSAGDEALIVWNRAPNGIAAARLDSQGNAPSVLAALTESDEALALALAWDGARYRLAWQVKTNGVNHVFAADVDPETLALDGAAIEYGVGEATHPKIAVSGDQLLVSYDAGAFGATFARFLPVSERVTELTRSGPRSIFTRKSGEGAPAITWSGDRYIVVWVRNDLHDVLVGRELRADGTPLGPAVPIATLSSSIVHNLGVASVGDVALVTWSDGGSLRALRVGRGLLALEPPVTIAAAYDADVATSGSDFAVVWIDPAWKIVYGRIIDADRPLTIEAPITIAENSEFRAVQVEWSADSYAVTFQELRYITCPFPIGASCGAMDAYVAGFSRSAKVGPPQLLARDVRSGDRGLGRGPNGVVYCWCGAAGCGADFLSGDSFSRINMATSSSGEVRDVVWTGQSFLLIGALNIFGFGETGVLLKPPFKTPGSSFPVPAMSVVAASSGDGRAMIVFISYERRTVHAAIFGVDPSRRRTVRH